MIIFNYGNKVEIDILQDGVVQVKSDGRVLNVYCSKVSGVAVKSEDVWKIVGLCEELINSEKVKVSFGKVKDYIVENIAYRVVEIK